MDPSSFQDFAGRIRRLMAAATTDAVRRQLALWAEEFEHPAEPSDRNPRLDKPKPRPAAE